MNRTIAELRNAIDAVDQQLLLLLNQRASLADEIGDIKRQEGSQVYRPEREAQVIRKLQTANQGPLRAESIANVWREVMSACRALEEPHRVAYLGPEGTFSEQAAEAFFGVSIEHVPCTSFDEVFEATASGRAAFGVVPMENSTEGVVTRSLDLFLTSPLHIIGETSLLIRHNLLRKQHNLAGIKAVYAHPQALAQCQPARRRTPCRQQQCRRCAPGRRKSGLGGHCQPTRRLPLRPACGGALHPGRGL